MSQALLAHLETETQYYQCLLQLLQSAEECLVGNQRSDLESNTQQQEKCAQLILHGNQSRHTLIQDIAPEAQTLSEVIPQISDLPLRIKIQAHKQKIEGLLTLVQHQSRRNQALIQQGLKYIEHSMDLMGQMAQSETPSTYTLYGQRHQAGGSPITSSCDFNA